MRGNNEHHDFAQSQGSPPSSVTRLQLLLLALGISFTKIVSLLKKRLLLNPSTSVSFTQIVSFWYERSHYKTGDRTSLRRSIHEYV
ncbi:hypothetical protein AB3R30_07200 [Leptolyngbyaceae cyanobacterium UHCC 1019]